MTAAQVKSAWAAREVLSRTEDARDARLRRDWSDPVLDGLDRKLADFEAALGSFAWPRQAPWFQARLVTAPQEASGKLSAVALPAGSATPELKAVSGGFDRNARTTLAPGTYEFDLSLGGDTETVSVQVAQGDTWGAVLGAVKDAVNAASLPARADVVRADAASGAGPGAPGTGEMLTVGINPLRPDQGLRLADRSGHLLSELRVKATDTATGPAREDTYSVSAQAMALPTLYSATPRDPNAAATLAVGRHDLALSVGGAESPSTYISKAFDPDAASTLAPGTYTFTSSRNGESRRHSVAIGSGWTWGQVLSAVSSEVNAGQPWLDPATGRLSGPSSAYSQPGVSAAVEAWPIPSQTDRNATADGLSLTVTGQAGGDFALGDGQGGLLSSLGLTTRLEGAPVSFNVRAGDTWRDVYEAAAIAVGGASLSVSARVEDTRVPSLTTPGRDHWHDGITLALVQQGQRIGERLRLADGRTGALSAMGLDARQRPGQDGRVTVNGRKMVSENDTYSLDRGRVLVSVAEPFAGDVPLSVRSAVDEVEKGWSRVTDAWNGLARYLSNNRDILDASLGARLEAPLAGHAEGLRWMGVSSAGKNGQLWTNLDAFWKALSADADKARETLAQEPEGLVPQWRRAADSVRQAGLESWLRPATSFDEHRPVLTSELELEQKHRLVKLLG